VLAVTQSQTFDHTVASVGAARRFVSQAICGVPAEVVETVALLVSELASNCIRHTDSRFKLAVTTTPVEIRVEATDGGTGEPAVRTPAPSDPTGRGLQIVDMLAKDWGVEQLPGAGKTVWFTVPVSEPGRVSAQGAG
jgi:anti-sigma regulatory factor (Ser/Thr protein kinase)